MKKNLRFYLTMIITKTVIRIMKLLGRNATNFPGSLALALCPDILGRIDKPETIIAVTGTNGKTTVSNMIADALEAVGFDFINNRYGGNVDTGIVSALINGSSVSGKPKKNMAVLEVDERSANRIYPYLKPSFLVCTNLSRDSFKRNAHTEFISDILSRYIPPETKLVLNGDDLIGANIAPENERVYFGIAWEDGELSVTDNIIRDIVVCPVCGGSLEYSFIRYNHIGRARCTGCDFKSPDIDYDVITRDYENREFILLTPSGVEKYTLAGTNITDIYNMAAAIAFLREFSIGYEQVRSAFDNMKIVETRFKHETIGEKHIFTMLAKGQNPIACSRACDFVRRQPGSKSVIMILEDFYDAKRTTENIAWIYETDFEFLNQDDIKQIIVGGNRFKDYLVRLLIAGIPGERIFVCENEADTAGLLDISSADSFFILYDLFNTVSLDCISSQIRNKLIMTEGNSA